LVKATGDCAVPSTVKVTVPVGVPPPGAATEAVTAGWPKTDGLAEEVTAVVVEAWLTVWVTELEVLVKKLESPPYVAVIECSPADSGAVVVQVAFPLVSSVAGAVQLMGLVPSLKATVPVGVGAPEATGVTGAVKVTGWP
jgi:hypothetical protein